MEWLVDDRVGALLLSNERWRHRSMESNERSDGSEVAGDSTNAYRRKQPGLFRRKA
jgi:hypothetical protein